MGVQYNIIGRHLQGNSLVPVKTPQPDPTQFFGETGFSLPAADQSLYIITP